MLIKEVSTLSDNMCDKEPAATLHWLLIPKNEWIGKHDHSYRGPEVPKLVYRVIMGNFDVNMFVFHDLIVEQLRIVFSETSSKRSVELDLSRRCHWLEVPILLHLGCCSYKLFFKKLKVGIRNIGIQIEFASGIIPKEDTLCEQVLWVSTVIQTLVEVVNREGIAEVANTDWNPGSSEFCIE